MWKSFPKYTKIFTVTMSNTFTYAFDILLKTTFVLILLYILTHLWKAAYEHGSTRIEGYSLSDMLWYLMFTEALVTSRGRPEEKIDQEVKSGNIAYMLNKPYNYLLFQLSLWTGEFLPQLITNFFAGSILIYFMAGPINFNFLTIVPLIITVIFATIMEFFIRMSIGLSAFWLEDVNMASFIYYKIIFVFGGMLIPLDFFPPLLKKIAVNLPFGFMVYEPAKLFIKFDWIHFLYVIKMQSIWILITGVICYFIYSRGLRRLNINGG
jgi:ABC-2 type transport system permease protein